MPRRPSGPNQGFFRPGLGYLKSFEWRDHNCDTNQQILILLWSSISKSCVLQTTSVAAQVCMDLFFSQLQSASQTCTVSEVAEDKKK